MSVSENLKRLSNPLIVLFGFPKAPEYLSHKHLFVEANRSHNQVQQTLLENAALFAGDGIGVQGLEGVEDKFEGRFGLGDVFAIRQGRLLI